MLLFKCECGKACSAQEAETGQHILCQHCGEQIQVPMSSEEDCLLLFRRGDPDKGQALTSIEFQHLLNHGELYRYDLIWKDGAWVPLGEVYELPPPPSVEVDHSISEIALDFQDLPAIEGYAKTPKKKKRAVKFDAPAVSSTDAGKSVKTPIDLKKRILTTFKVLAVLCILLLGAVRLGRIINFVLKRISNIMVINTFEVPCRFKVSGYSWQELPKNSSITQPDVCVAFSCRKKILFSASLLDPASGLPLAAESTSPEMALVPAYMRIPVKPGFDTLVNPGGRAALGVYDFSKLASLSLSSPELKSLSNELTQAKAPISVLKVNEQIQDLVKDSYIETRKDPFFCSKDFNFDSLGIVRNVDFANQGGKGDDGKKTVANPPFSLVYPVARALNFSNGSIVFDPKSNDTDKSITLVSKEFNPKPGYSVTAAVPRLQIRHEKNFLVLQLSNLNGSVKGVQNAVYNASWSYTARMNKVGKWTWLWTAKYQKPGDGKKAPEERILTIDQNGTETWPKGK
jgi:hypothetical protein